MDAEVLFNNEPGEYTVFATLCFAGDSPHDSTARSIRLHDESVRFLKIEELIMIKDIVERTLLFYNENGITDDIINESNILFEDYYRRCDEAKKKRAALYDAVIKKHAISNSDFRSPHYSNSPTNVYVIRDPSNGSLKVGQSSNPQKRLESFKTSNISDLSLIYTHKAQSRDESMLHHILKCGGYHIKGEWFIDTPDVIDIVIAHFERREKR